MAQNFIDTFCLLLHGSFHLHQIHQNIQKFSQTKTTTQSSHHRRKQRNWFRPCQRISQVRNQNLINNHYRYGDHVHICSTNQKSLENALSKLSHPNISGSVCDIRDPSQVEQFVQDAQHKLKEIDIWVFKFSMTKLTIE